MNPDLKLSKDDPIIHYKKYGYNEGRIIPNYKYLFINYKNNSKYICHEKWYQTLMDIKIRYNTITLTNDSFIITDKLPDIDNFNNYEMTGMINSYESQYHIPDFFRIYNKSGIDKWIKYYEKNIKRCKNFYDMIKIMEIKTSHIYNNVNTIFKVPKNYNKNIHFDNINQEYFYNKYNYPIIKLKKLIFTRYDIPDDLQNNINKYKKKLISYEKLYKVLIHYMPDFNINDYKNNHIDLEHMNNIKAFNHFIIDGIKEGRKYNVNQVSYVPNYLKKKIYEKDILDLL